jgi:chorismate synthase
MVLSTDSNEFLYACLSTISTLNTSHTLLGLGLKAMSLSIANKSTFAFVAGNSTGTLFRLSTFGESHGPAIGGVIDGCPAGIELDIDFIQRELDRRKPGQSSLSSPRKESDQVQILSGVFEGKTLGTPIGFVIPNEDAKSKDYSHLKDLYRPSHADFTWEHKFGIRDYRGGGRASARETACRVVGGAVAKLILKHHGVKITAFVSQVGSVSISENTPLDLGGIDSNPVRCPSPLVAQKMVDIIEKVKQQGDTVGGCIDLLVEGVPVGWGEPVFDKLHASLAKALFSINAVKGVELGEGFASAGKRGSEINDVFINDSGKVKTQTNFSGGIQGGISNGESLRMKIAFKPVATVFKSQKTINKSGEEVEFKAEGRHDPCVVPRAVPIVEAMAALVLADFHLLSKSNRI